MTADKKTRLVVLISGNGSNLQAFIDAIDSGSLGAEIVAVFSNKSDAFGLERAARAGIPVIAINPKIFDNREAFDRELADQIESNQPDLVILAGFMRILSDEFVNRFTGKILNIHPSLLPKYPGLNTHQRAIDAGDRAAGSTVHFVTPKLDSGPAIIQVKVPVLADDNVDTLAARVLIQEHKIYPLAAQWFCQQRLSLSANQVLLDGNALPTSGYTYCNAAGSTSAPKK